MREPLESEPIAARPPVAARQRHGRRAVAKSRPRSAETANRAVLPIQTVEPNSLLVRLLDRAPAGFIKTFSDEQIAGLNRALVNADTRYHSIDFRTSVWFFGIPFYVTFLMGRERRTAERLAAEGQTQMHRVAIVHIILTLLAGLSLTAAVACILYLLKSAVGINIFDGHSPLHELFFS